MLFVSVLLLVLVLLLYRGLSETKTPDRYKKHYHYQVKPQLQPQLLQQQVNTLPVKEPSIPIKGEPSKPLIPPELVHFQLLKVNESEPQIMEQIIKITQSVPRAHPMLQSLVQGAKDTEELFELVNSDPVIAAKILQTVNSANFYLTQKITRLNHAILYLGTMMIKNIAIQCVISSNKPSKDRRLNLFFEKIWANSFLASSLTFIFAKHMGLDHAADLATQTLLTYIGNIAIITYKPQLASILGERSSLFERTKIEQRELGTHSALVGSQLATEWKLPQEIIDSIRNNLIPLGVDPEQCELQGEYLRDIVFCYVCCRISEHIMDKDLQDLAEVNLLDCESLELFYLPEYLRVTGLQEIFNLFHNPVIRTEVNRLIQKTGPMGDPID